MSWIEVESKIKVDNVKSMRKNIKGIAKFVKIENKIDDYYSLEIGKYPKKSLRIRHKGKIAEVNFKGRKSYSNGVWAKKEVEFKVSDLKNFFELLDNFGFKKWLRKEKRTELYKTKDGVNIEINFVKGLGWFVEIEILCRVEDVKKSRIRINEIERELGVSKNQLEKDGYTKVLWNKKRQIN